MAARVPRSLLDVPSWDGDGALRMVVESPAGSRVKLTYDPDLGAFVLGRPLPLGIVYPFDWGFVPGTRAADGDPVDALLLLDAPTFPGVIVSVRALAVLEVEQDDRRGGRERNDRLIVAAAEARRPRSRIARAEREELEHFFTAVTTFQDKNLAILGWGSAAAAERLVERSQVRPSRRARR